MLRSLVVFGCLIASGVIAWAQSAPAPSIMRKVASQAAGDVVLNPNNVVGSGSAYGCSGCSASAHLLLYDGSTGATQLWNSGPYNMLFGTGNLERMRITGAGNVGIGTASPQQRLQVQGSTSLVQGAYTLSGETNGARVFSLDSGGSGYGRAALVAANGGYSTFAVKSDPLGREYGLAGLVGSAADYAAGGRHAIGVYGYTLFNIPGTHTNGLNLQTAGIFISELGSAVTDYRSTQYGVFARADARPATGSAQARQYGVFAEAWGRAVDSAVGGYFTASGGAGSRGIQVSAIAAGAGNYSIYSDAAAQTYIAGSVGIGLAAPTEKLHVDGNIKATGNIAADGTIFAKYQDVAEWVPAAEAVEAGTVVVIDAGAANRVMACARPYDTSVAGVVSAQPGLVLGEAGRGKEMVATTGRVRVKVDASVPIRAGDILVSSHKPGRAMKSVPVEIAGITMHRPGTIIGKALESLESGEGEILVLLSLQ